jgi:ABC-type antimicrobial peptide transport system permease subunit
MFKYYFKIALRSLSKNRTSSIVNIGGLTIGIAVALLIGLWVYDELSFNKYHQNYDRIGRILIRGNDVKEGPFISTSLPYPLATELLTNYNSNFKHLVRTSWDQDYIVSYGEKKLSRMGKFMDAEGPEMFALKMVNGNWAGLKDPHSIMLSVSTSKAIFDDKDPINQVITLNNKTNLKVTGVYEDLPANSEFSYIKFISTWDLWVSENEWILNRASNDWMNHFLSIYAEIPNGSSFAKVDEQIADAEYSRIKLIDKFKEQTARNPKIFIHPMSNWHLKPLSRDNGQVNASPMRMLWLVIVIGIFVLLLACINFMNLSTARSEKRAKEVGIRKTIGSERNQLIYQFLGESFLVVMVSFVLACIFVSLSLSWFNDMAGKEMNMPWTDVYFWTICLGFIFITGLLAGSYPAFYLSSFQPIRVLKGTFRVGRNAVMPRKVLVVLQFTVSITLIICTIVVYQQVKFAKDRPVGYTREGLIMVDMKSDDFQDKYELFRNSLLNTGVVTEISESRGMVTEVVSGNNGFDWKGRDPGKEESFGTLAVTHEHGKTIGWQFVAGRDFSRFNISDSTGVIMNEAAAKYMELSNPVGETITWKWRDNQPVPYTVLGIIKDAVMESPYEAVEPTMFFIKPLNGGVSCINIRVSNGVAMSKALPKIEAVFKELVPKVPFDYKFADEEYALKFKAEERFSDLVGFFGMFAIFISCLGLFGLASFTAEQRTKEIGVRKVLGASIFNVWRLLSREFVGLVIISLLLASPVAWYYMNNWLQNYPYRTEFSWWIIPATAVGALLITILTVSFQAIKAAIANPVNSLRNE